MLLVAKPEVTADSEAWSLLRTIDASCAALLRIVSNVLYLRTLSGDVPPLPRALGVFNPRAVVARMLTCVRALDSVPPRLTYVTEDPPFAPLPEHARGDEEALSACLLNWTLLAMRMGIFVKGVPVRLRITAQQRARENVSLHVATEGAAAEPANAAAAGAELFLHAFADTSCRAMTAAEIRALLEPAGMFPADLGGGAGLPLQVARHMARAAGGDVDIYNLQGGGVTLTFRLPLFDTPPMAVASTTDASVPASPSPATPAPPTQEARGVGGGGGGGHVAGEPAPDESAAQARHTRRKLIASPPPLPPRCMGPQPADDLLLTQAMLAHLLTNCDDVFALSRPSGGDTLRLDYVTCRRRWSAALASRLMSFWDTICWSCVTRTTAPALRRRWRRHARLQPLPRPAAAALHTCTAAAPWQAASRGVAATACSTATRCT